ncbi:AFG1-family ATPase [Thecamonas trahens ATCC 50062]|uniref:AFG1-family ATPase n=1 Tax=Thecamonas trahens ATCC 50062 TaxID=461836 RepID=A0A0L0DEG3_THETB|nr:AFG1-family ATPase [Thecamonas trahens ATCC 50062]KNC50585.1 AFG1-family ATPase [Thecamonas trahens ATCC 50062]|eukprot:XP_013762474.1 AFG1-family ATPase [Thecamonas trahens ATCC 50062]
MAATFGETYAALVAGGKLRVDPVQQAAVAELTRLEERVLAWEASGGPGKAAAAAATGRGASAGASRRAGGWLGSLLGGGGVENGANKTLAPPAGLPKGLYMYGGVGCGKTMLMDAFYEHVDVGSKARVSFHTFMLRVHAAMHKWKQSEGAKARQAGGESRMMGDVAAEMVRSGWLLCFDEFQVTDIATAMIIRQLFENLFAHGAVVMATSNRPPNELYLGGLQRDLFLPFIDLLNERCEVHHLASNRDYRAVLSAESAAQPTEGTETYMFPLAQSVEERMEAAFAQATADASQAPAPMELPVMMGRKIVIPRAANRVAWISFSELCEAAVYSADYLALTEAFDSVFITGVPQLGEETPNEARRFVTLIDQLYEAGVKVVLSAEVPLNELYQGIKRDAHGVEVSAAGDGGGKGAGSGLREDVAFAFDRTVSRILEMNSDDAKCVRVAVLAGVAVAAWAFVLARVAFTVGSSGAQLASVRGSILGLAAVYVTLLVVHWMALGVVALDYVAIYLKVVLAALVALHYALQVVRLFRFGARFRKRAMVACACVIAVASAVLAVSFMAPLKNAVFGSNVSCKRPAWILQSSLEFAMALACLAGAVLLTRRLRAVAALSSSFVAFELKHMWLLTVVFVVTSSVSLGYEIAELVQIRTEADCTSYLDSPKWAAANAGLRVVVLILPVVTTVAVFASLARKYTDKFNAAGGRGEAASR